MPAANRKFKVRPGFTTPFVRRGDRSLAPLLALLHCWRHRPISELCFIYPRVRRALRHIPPEYQERADQITHSYFTHMRANYGHLC